MSPIIKPVKHAMVKTCVVEAQRWLVTPAMPAFPTMRSLGPINMGVCISKISCPVEYVMEQTIWVEGLKWLAMGVINFTPIAMNSKNRRNTAKPLPTTKKKLFARNAMVQVLMVAEQK